MTTEGDELTSLREEVARLRRRIAKHEALLNDAGKTITRDAAEVVRVLAELERREAIIKTDLHHALRFQRAMQPQPLEDPRLTVQAIYLPADVISGDFYDVARISPDVVRIFVADATGHGVAAGLATMFIKSEYEAQKREQRGPSAVLTSINRLMSSTYENLEMRFTALCIDVDLAKNRVVYSPGAHPGPLVATRDGVVELPSGGTFVGLTSEASFPQHEAPLAPGDALLAFTDGLSDAEAADGNLFGDARVKDLLVRARREDRIAAELIVEELSTFVGAGRRLSDDVTILTLRRA